MCTYWINWWSVLSIRLSWAVQINTSDLEALLRKQIIQEWRDLDQINPDDLHACIPAESWRNITPILECPLEVRPAGGTFPIDNQKIGWSESATKPSLPSYLPWRQNIPYHLSRALSRLRLSVHNFNVELLRQQQHRVPSLLRICTQMCLLRLQFADFFFTIYLWLTK